MNDETTLARLRTARSSVEREWDATIDRLATLAPDGWQHPTRCAGWTIEDLARHAVWGVSMEADALRRLRLGEAGPADGYVVPAGTSTTEVLASLRKSLADLVDELGRLGPDELRRTAPMPYGDVPVPAVLDVFVMEAAIHGDDVAHALGDTRPLHPDVIEPTAAVLTAFIPVFASMSQARPADGSSFSLAGASVSLAGTWTDGGLTMGALEPSATVTLTGDDTAVLLFALGRVPADDGRLTVTGDQELARDFKGFVPGP